MDRKTSGRTDLANLLFIIHLLCQIIVTVRLPDTSVLNKIPKKIEKIQERALQFIYNDSDSSYETLLQNSKLPTLKTRRMRTIALETFKIIHKKSPLFLQDLV